MALGHLLYISDAVQPITHRDLEAIRMVSARSNAQLQITGVLFYSAGHFVQLLEGEPAMIRALFAKIKGDPRHCEVKLLVERLANRRVFPDWSMGLLDLDEFSAAERRDLDELVRLASHGEVGDDGTPVELEILSRFCMLLPAA